LLQRPSQGRLRLGGERLPRAVRHRPSRRKTACCPSTAAVSAGSTCSSTSRVYRRRSGCRSRSQVPSQAHWQNSRIYRRPSGVRLSTSSRRRRTVASVARRSGASCTAKASGHGPPKSVRTRPLVPKLVSRLPSALVAHQGKVPAPIADIGLTCRYQFAVRLHHQGGGHVATLTPGSMPRQGNVQRHQHPPPATRPCTATSSFVCLESRQVSWFSSSRRANTITKKRIRPRSAQREPRCVFSRRCGGVDCHLTSPLPCVVPTGGHR
jgi:hypothetical protein